MGAANLTEAHNDGDSFYSAVRFSSKGVKLFIDQPIYIGDTRVDLSEWRWSGSGLSINGLGPLKSTIITKGAGGFYTSSWAHNFRLTGIGFRGGDSEYRGCPIAISGDGDEFGGGYGYELIDVHLYHYKFALPLHSFVSRAEMLQAYDCTYGFAFEGTSTGIGSVWARHCDVGYLWGAAINRETYEPELSPYPLRYVFTSNVAADGCELPHKFYQFRSLQFGSLGVEGITGTHVLDFSEIRSSDDQFTMTIDGILCNINSENAPDVTHFIELPPSEYRCVSSVLLRSGYVKSSIPIELLKNSQNPTNRYKGRAFELGDNFMFIKSDDLCVVIDQESSGTKFGGRWYGELQTNNRNSYDGTTLSAAHVDATAFYLNTKTESGTVLVPNGCILDILIGTIGEETRYESGVFVAGSVDIFPLNKSGTSQESSGGRILFSSSGATQEDVAKPTNIWVNTDSGSKSLSGVSVAKEIVGDQTYVRIKMTGSELSIVHALVHITLSYSGFAHYYDKRWRVIRP